MSNHQETFNEKNSAKSQMQTKENKDTTKVPNTESGSQLDQLVSFIKNNWKSVLTELVSAGVAAYLAHSAKEKASATQLKQ